jgi:hypothetical protein
MSPPRLLPFHLFAAVLLFCGCAPVNVRLNDPNTPLGQGVKNQTRSAVFADVSKPGGPTTVSLLLSEKAIYPPAQTQPGPIDSDGFFAAWP